MDNDLIKNFSCTLESVVDTTPVFQIQERLNLLCARANLRGDATEVLRLANIGHGFDTAMREYHYNEEEPDSGYTYYDKIKYDLREALPLLRHYENQLASSLSCDSRSHDADRENRKILLDAIEAINRL